MKKTFHFILIFIIILSLTGCLIKKSEEPLKEVVEATKPLTSTSITYFPNAEKFQLKSGEPQENMRLAKKISLKETDGIPSSTLHLYVDINNSNLIYGFLEVGGNRYDVGIVSNEGIALVEVKISHWTGVGNSEIQITSPMNPKTERLQLLRFNPDAANWERFDFQGHPTQTIDLDGDGKEELVGNNITDVPPYVEVHRWNTKEATFETAQIDTDVAKLYNLDRDKVLTYSYLFLENGQWIIEFGTAEEVHFMNYKNGVLEYLEMKDSRSRLKELTKGHDM